MALRLLELPLSATLNNASNLCTQQDLALLIGLGSFAMQIVFRRLPGLKFRYLMRVPGRSEGSHIALQSIAMEEVFLSPEPDQRLVSFSKASIKRHI